MDIIAEDVKILESFHLKCQRQILGIRWQDHVWNVDVANHTGLLTVTEQAVKRSNSISVTSPRYRTPSQSTKLCAAVRLICHSVDAWQIVEASPRSSSQAMTGSNPWQKPSFARWCVERCYQTRSFWDDATVLADHAIRTTKASYLNGYWPLPSISIEKVCTSAVQWPLCNDHWAFEGER